MSFQYLFQISANWANERLTFTCNNRCMCCQVQSRGNKEGEFSSSLSAAGWRVSLLDADLSQAFSLSSLLVSHFEFRCHDSVSSFSSSEYQVNGFPLALFVLVIVKSVAFLVRQFCGLTIAFFVVVVVAGVIHVPFIASSVYVSIFHPLILFPNDRFLHHSLRTSFLFHFSCLYCIFCTSFLLSAYAVLNDRFLRLSLSTS